jgi:hypothetical protein
MIRDQGFQSDFVSKLVSRNEQMEKTLIALATKVADSLNHLSKSFVPLLDSKEREN